MRSHHSAYRKAVESYCSCPWACLPAALPQSPPTNKAKPQPSRDHHPASTDSHCVPSPSRRSGQHPAARPRERRAWPAEEEEETAESESDGGVECDLSNMEITEELRQYFAQTERHREERRKCAPPARFPSSPCLSHGLLPSSYFVTSQQATSSPTSALSASRGIFRQDFFLALEQGLSRWSLCRLLSKSRSGGAHGGVPVFPDLPPPLRAVPPTSQMRQVTFQKVH